jgi:hypothetical protein
MNGPKHFIEIESHTHICLPIDDPKKPLEIYVMAVPEPAICIRTDYMKKHNIAGRVIPCVDASSVLNKIVKHVCKLKKKVSK